MAISLRRCHTQRHLASLINASLKHLRYVCYGLGTQHFYKSWDIPKKSGGTRTILAPKDPVLGWQRALLPFLNELYVPRDPAHGFVASRSIITNATEHVGKSWVLNVDLEDFFGTITSGRVFGALRAGPVSIPDDVASLVADICTVNGALPIGAPTSPVISNIVSRRMDRDLLDLSKRFHLRYTRYADDLTFSGRKPHFPPEIAEYEVDGTVRVGHALDQVITDNGFAANARKVRLAGAHSSQRATGITVNVKLNVDRRWVRNLRAMMHNYETQGPDACRSRYIETKRGARDPNRATPDFLRVLRGKVDHLGHVRGRDDALYRKYLAKLERLETPGASLYHKDPGVSSVKILHLSDFHFRLRDRHHWNRMLQQLVHQVVASTTPDLVITTGDIAFSGTAAEYELAVSWFRDDVVPALSIPRERYLFVPGNHDVDRSGVSTLTRQLRPKPLDDAQPSLTDALNSPAERAIIEQPFERYRNFCQEINEGHPSGLWYRHEVLIGEITIAIAGLCSPLLSYDDHDERDRLLLGMQQASETLSGDDVDYHLAALHHPSVHLKDRSTAFLDIDNWADLVLTGHEHADSSASISKPHSQTLHVSGGSVYQGDTRLNSVHLIEVELPSKSVHIDRWHWTHERVWERSPSRDFPVTTANSE